MTDIGYEFVLLTVGDSSASGSQLQTRRVKPELRTACFVALDAQGERHFLVEAEKPFVGDSSSQGVTVTPRLLVLGEVETLFADLHCHMADLELVFERLVEDVIQRLESDESQRPEIICRVTIADWRALLKSASSSLTREEVIGLVGELEVLARLTQDPAGAIAAWTGPLASVHDFSFEGHDLEVKSTASVDGNFVKVSNLDQMDPEGLEALHLVVVHLREDTAGLTLDARIRALIDAGFPRDLLLERVADAGYVFESEADENLRYSVRSVRVWHVNDGFPGLRRNELGQRLRGVSNVRYELALDVGPREVQEPEEFLTTWMEG